MAGHSGLWLRSEGQLISLAVLQAEWQPWKAVRKLRWACPEQSWVQAREGGSIWGARCPGAGMGPDTT